MLKSFFLKVIQVVALTVLIAQFTFSSAFAQAQLSPTPEPVTTPTPTPEAYSQEEPATDLVRLFLKNNPIQEYNMKAIKRFNDELYGEDAN